MTLRQLLVRNLRYHWRGNLAILLGVVVGTAALTGALLVGASLRGSLQALTLRQLGWIDQVLIGSRMVRAELASQLGAERVSPVLLLRGSANVEGKRARGKVTIAGVGKDFWKEAVPKGTAFWDSSEDAVVLSAALASELGVKAGDTVALHVQKASQVPRESLLGRRDAGDVVDELRLTIAEVLPEDHFGSHFSLNPIPTSPRNAFVPLRALQSRLNLNGRVNALLAGSGAGDLQQALHNHLTLDDWGLNLEIRNSKFEIRNSYLSLESRQLLLEPAAVRAAEAAAKQLGLPAAPTLVYLANRIAHGQESIAYSIVAALDPQLPPPLGLPSQPPLHDGEVLLADWKASPIHAQKGAAIQLTYFQPEEQGRLNERTETLRFAGLVPMEGTAADPNLTPPFPGITDKLEVRDWNPPFPFDNKRIQKRDEDYWKQYRTTPKAYVTLATGQKLWASRFGDLTSIRFVPLQGTDLPTAARDLRRELLARLQPEQGGLVFDHVRERSLEAGGRGSDFGFLFLGFSSFLIGAALLLVGLLFRLNIDRRAGEIGLLLATGFRRARVRGLLLVEGAVLAALGALLGCALAVLYAWVLLDLLAAWWPAALERSFLQLHVDGTSLLIGYLGSVAVCILTILWAVRVLSRLSPSVLIASGDTVEMDSPTTKRPARRSAVLAAAAAGLGAMVIVWSSFDRRLATNHEMLAGMFLTGGFLLLSAGLLAVWSWMKWQQAIRDTTRVIGPSAFVPRPLFALGVRNAARYPLRSLLTAGLLASAAFLIVAVDSFRRQPDAAFLDRNGGSGGFSLVAESDVPIYQDMNTESGQDELNFSTAARRQLHGVPIIQMRLRAGDDASCLNLYQPLKPRLLGVPDALIQRGGFHFQSSAGPTNPWRLLSEPQADGAIPVFGEANTLQWMLKLGLGDTLKVPNERGVEVTLRIVGVLKDSIFQSELVMSEQHFLQLYPSQEGYNYFLIDAAPAQMEAVRKALEDALAERGFVATPTVERLGEYLAVENTYLSTFQALGGLGLLLGAMGLAVVLLRSVWERRGELALLRALGYRKSAIGWLILAENGFLLTAGLAIGTVAALLSVLPRFYEATGSVSVARLVGFLGLVLVAGMFAGIMATVTTLRAPLLPALRRE